MVAREAIVCLEALEGDRFEFPINPRGIKVRRGRNVNVVPILGLGEVVQPGSIVPVEISFDTLLLRYPDSTLNNYRYTEKPEQSIERLERWMGRTKEGKQENPHIIRVVVSATGFSREMVLTEVGTEYREAEPDAVYISVTLKEWRRQVVRITQGTARPLLEEVVEEAATGGPTAQSPVVNEGAFKTLFPGGTQQTEGSSSTRPRSVTPPFHIARAGESLQTLAERYGEDGGSSRLFADRIYAANAHKWEPGGPYHNKYAYFDGDGNQVPKPEYWTLRNFFGGPGVVGGPERRKLYQPPLSRSNIYQALPPGVVLTLPGGGRDFRHDFISSPG